MRLNFLFFLFFNSILISYSQKAYGTSFIQKSDALCNEIETLPIESIKSHIQGFLSSLDKLLNQFDELILTTNFVRSNLSSLPKNENPIKKNSPKIYDHLNEELEIEEKFLSLFNELSWLDEKKRDLGTIKTLNRKLYAFINKETIEYTNLLKKIHEERKILIPKINENAELIENYLEQILSESKDIDIKKFFNHHQKLTSKIELFDQLFTELKVLLTKTYTTAERVNSFDPDIFHKLT